MFFVKVEATQERFAGRRVYVSAKGTPVERKFVILDVVS
jgi:hypothetical protein